MGLNQGRPQNSEANVPQSDLCKFLLRSSPRQGEASQWNRLSIFTELRAGARGWLGSTLGHGEALLRARAGVVSALRWG